MRGTYRGEERISIREDWLKNHIPHFIVEEIAPLERFISKMGSITAIDGGPNKGFWSKALIDVYKDRVNHIYMIDASPENFNELSNKEDSLLFSGNDFDKITPIHNAVSDTTGAIDFYNSDDGSPIGSVFPHTVAGESTISAMGVLDKVMSVPCDTIDNIIASHGIGHIDLMKLDIEGNELSAMRGAEKAISSGNIDVIMYEFGIHQVDARHFFRDFWEFLTKHGYTIYKIVDGHPHIIKEYSYVHENFTTCWNFVASRL